MSKSDLLPTATRMAHRFVSDRLLPNGRAIDATAGNGHDTIYLAQKVGTGGRVYAFDIQDTAIDSTAAKTSELPQVELFCLGHEKMGRIVTDPVDVIMFNLGYFPMGDKSIITRSETTLQALETAKNLLSPNGLITIALYTGHAGGREEHDSVFEWAKNLDQTAFSAASYAFLNQRNSPPSLMVIERKG